MERTVGLARPLGIDSYTTNSQLTLLQCWQELQRLFSGSPSLKFNSVDTG